MILTNFETQPVSPKSLPESEAEPQPTTLQAFKVSTLSGRGLKIGRSFPALLRRRAALVPSHIMRLLW